MFSKVFALPKLLMLIGVQVLEQIVFIMNLIKMVLIHIIVLTLIKPNNGGIDLFGIMLMMLFL